MRMAKKVSRLYRRVKLFTVSEPGNPNLAGREFAETILAFSLEAGNPLAIVIIGTGRIVVVGVAEGRLCKTNFRERRAIKKGEGLLVEQVANFW